jgi:hypothetical protein
MVKSEFGLMKTLPVTNSCTWRLTRWLRLCLLIEFSNYCWSIRESSVSRFRSLNSLRSIPNKRHSFRLSSALRNLLELKTSEFPYVFNRQNSWDPELKKNTVHYSRFQNHILEPFHRWRSIRSTKIQQLTKVLAGMKPSHLAQNFKSFWKLIIGKLDQVRHQSQRDKKKMQYLHK